MGLLDKFKKTAQKPESVSEGGSAIYRYEDKEDDELGPPASEPVYLREITEYFSSVFQDREEYVFHEIISDFVHIDVHILRPTEEQNFYFVYTTGMSDLPMTMPEELSDREDLKYAELYTFMPSNWNPGSGAQVSSDLPESEYWIINILKYLARFPHAYNTWFAYGHTIPNGPDYAPLTPGTSMGGIVLSQFGGKLEGFTTKDGTRTNFLYVIPAYKEEIEYKLKYGMEELDKIYTENDITLTVDLHRPNYCKDFHEQLD